MPGGHVLFTAPQTQSKSDGRNMDFEILPTMSPAPMLFTLSVHTESSKQVAKENNVQYVAS
jgi:hypothetical protein